MNTSLYPRVSPPLDPEPQHLVSVRVPDDLRRLRLVDRLSLRIGLWLLQRDRRPERSPRRLRVDTQLLDHRRSAAGAATLLSDPHRQMR